jgi:3'-phosphoadenosine 5'-phosphosulfate sulfotransferase (PAPS reductase)/FAD synthetase
LQSLWKVVSLCLMYVAGLCGILTFFFHNDDDFQEVVDFALETNERYHLCMRVLNGDFRQGLKDMLETSEVRRVHAWGAGGEKSAGRVAGCCCVTIRQACSVIALFCVPTRGPFQVRAIILGTRRGDPNAADQQPFCPSSRGWPPFMRINPILDWGYADVWAFLCGVGLAYCSLYDQGYTSIGSVHNTQPNRYECPRVGVGVGVGVGCGVAGRSSPRGHHQYVSCSVQTPHVACGSAWRLPAPPRTPSSLALLLQCSALLREDGTYAPAIALPDARLERAARGPGHDSAGGPVLQRRQSAYGPNRTACLVIVGDELLSAKVEDLNTRFLCSELRAAGWKVCKVGRVCVLGRTCCMSVRARARCGLWGVWHMGSGPPSCLASLQSPALLDMQAVMVRDDVASIAGEVRCASASHDVVITAGGLGPTLDDVTMQAVAGEGAVLIPLNVWLSVIMNQSCLFSCIQLLHWTQPNPSDPVSFVCSPMNSIISAFIHVHMCVPCRCI